MPAVAELHTRVAVWLEPAIAIVTLLGEIDPQVSPEGTVSVNDTVPVKEPCPVTVMVDVADVLTVTPVGDVADTAKSITPNVNIAVVL